MKPVSTRVQGIDDFPSRLAVGLSFRGAVNRPLSVWLAATALAAGLLAVLAIWTPSSAPGASICVFRHVGLTCPGCGMTRALALLAKGDPVSAFAMHPLAPVVTVEALLFWSISGVLIVTRRWRGPSWGIWNTAIAGQAALFLLVWIVGSLY